jgi:hypothetical protein
MIQVSKNLLEESEREMSLFGQLHNYETGAMDAPSTAGAAASQMKVLPSKTPKIKVSIQVT